MGGYYFALLFVKISAIISLIHRISNSSTSGCAALQPAPSNCFFTPGATPSLSFNLSAASSVLFFSTMAVDSLISRPFSTVSPLDRMAEKGPGMIPSALRRVYWPVFSVVAMSLAIMNVINAAVI